MDWIPQDIVPVQYVFENLGKSEYLIKFANNIEITNRRLSINTKDMEL